MVVPENEVLEAPAEAPKGAHPADAARPKKGREAPGKYAKDMERLLESEGQYTAAGTHLAELLQHLTALEGLDDAEFVQEMEQMVSSIGAS